jgi:hypothetical protein
MSEDKGENSPDWKKLEYLVVSIQQQLSPDARVKHNVYLDGVDSETKRQIDVLVEQNIGQYTIKIVIDCKDYSKPVDVKGVEEFHGLVRDVRAHKGALVCPSGFTKAALKLAKKLQIDLYRPVSTGKHKWQANVSIPVICDFRNCYISFGLRGSDPKPLMIPQEFYNLPVFDSDGNDMGTSLNNTLEKWDNGLLPSAPGEHDHVEIFEHDVFIDNGYGDKTKVSLTAGLFVKQNLYLGYLPVEEIEGLHDEHSGYVVSNAFTTGILSPEDVEKNWKKIDDEKELKIEPVFKITGYHCFGVGT